MSKRSAISNKIIAISGFSGFVGKRLVNQLGARNFKKIYLISRKSNLITFDFKNCELINIGISYGKIKKHKSKLRKVDVFYHLAYENSLIEAINNKKKILNNNLGPIKKILNDLKPGSIFIFTSSASVYGSSLKKITENSAINPLSNYDINKILCENYIKKFCNINKINYLIFRLSNIYGAQIQTKNNRGFLFNFIRKIYTNSNILLNTNGKYYRDYLYIDDCIKGLEKAMLLKKKHLNKTYNLFYGKSYTLVNIFNFTKKIFLKKYNHKNLSNLFVNQYKNINPTDSRNFFGSSKLYQTSAKWKPFVDIRSGITKVLNDIKN